MTALATIADYEAITGTTVASGAETTRVTRLLDLASSAVLAGAHGQLIAQNTTTSLVVQPYEGIAYLPQRPIISITTVVYEGATLTTGTDYRHEPGGNGRPAKLVRRCNGHDASWLCDLTVTYIHGWAEVPGQIIGAVVAMVKSTIDNDGGSEATSETAGPYSESWDNPQQAGFALTESTADMVCALTSVKAPTSVPVGIGAP